MKVYDVVQGSPEWARLRLGIPTASAYKQIITPVRLDYSTSAKKYACGLVAEMLTGESVDAASSKFMQRGSGLEAEAVSWYEMDQDVDVKSVGFITNDDGTTGGSPDGLVGEKGGLEIKSLNAVNHVWAMQNMKPFLIDTRLQVQGNLWITDREWWDVLLFHPCPRMDSIVVRVERDEKVIEFIEYALDRFQDELNDVYKTAHR